MSKSGSTLIDFHWLPLHFVTVQYITLHHIKLQCIIHKLKFYGSQFVKSNNFLICWEHILYRIWLWCVVDFISFLHLFRILNICRHKCSFSTAKSNGTGHLQRCTNHQDPHKVILQYSHYNVTDYNVVCTIKLCKM